MRCARPLISLTLVITLTACAGSAGRLAAAPSPSPSEIRSPVEILAAAADKSFESSVRLNTLVDFATTTRTEIDLDPSKAMRLAVAGDERYELLVIGMDLYYDDNTGTWLHLDLNRLRPSSPLLRQTEVASGFFVLDGAIDISEPYRGRFEGRIDLNRAAKAASTERHRRFLELLMTFVDDGEFAATVDAQGRLIYLSYRLWFKEAGAMRVEMGLSNFGVPVSVTRPPADQVREATDAMYTRL